MLQPLIERTGKEDLPYSVTIGEKVVEFHNMQSASIYARAHVDDNSERRAIDGPPKSTFEGGSTRSEQDGRFDLMPPAALRAMARRLKLGAEIHGDRNWEGGGEAFRQATLSHLLAHIVDYMERGGRDNTDAIICNAAFLAHFEESRPYKSAS